MRILKAIAISSTRSVIERLAIIKIFEQEKHVFNVYGIEITRQRIFFFISFGVPTLISYAFSFMFVDN